MFSQISALDVVAFRWPLSSLLVTPKLLLCTAHLTRLTCPLCISLTAALPNYSFALVPNPSPLPYPPSSPTTGFWEMYDPEGFSLHFCDYKFNEENTVKFVTLNKVSGFLQRMDLARKYAFAKMCILGPDAGPFIIKGVWLFRGPVVPQFVLDECYDCELYEWTKVRGWGGVGTLCDK